MSEKYFSDELLNAIEDFIDAKSGQDWASQQKPYSRSLFEVATKNVDEKRDKLKEKLTAMSWALSAK